MSIEIKKSDSYSGVLFLAIAIAIYVISGGFPTPATNGPDPAFFPRVIALCIAILAVVQIAQSWLRSTDTVHEVKRKEIKRVLVPIFLMVVYVATLPLLGFIAGTIFFLSSLLLYSGVESAGFVAAFSCVFVLVLQFVFGSFLHIPLPDGVLPIFRSLPDLLFLSGVTL
ncbi:MULTISPECIES: tripartite tricarboxylate transporter TctB family protein [unclassified Haladaptatus]|uniref:tripartite tricarboxylate transporter TctB family protein n=1 Tax=unclassified Haladaptatus TaxID=2622732 RepID=UPI00209BD5DA|nr:MULTISPECIES: tripartite tricarboxylate transporter TctB family protein [unclassified Haladaptatus]MCO8244906.1 tripartite tricarboxylate transporter TctB family protein [Haladaptatus sp. AB643]MCO8255581.1 tripartite tricarboxylate transporter TctB family protein [Haladaptatus sp. AB618]